jgi:hypothetical protein
MKLWRISELLIDFTRDSLAGKRKEVQPSKSLFGRRIVPFA